MGEDLASDDDGSDDDENLKQPHNQTTCNQTCRQGVTEAVRGEEMYSIE